MTCVAMYESSVLGSSASQNALRKPALNAQDYIQDLEYLK